MNNTVTLNEMLALAETSANLDGAMDAEAYDVWQSLMELAAADVAADAADDEWVRRMEAEEWYAAVAA